MEINISQPSQESEINKFALWSFILTLISFIGYTLAIIFPSAMNALCVMCPLGFGSPITILLSMILGFVALILGFLGIVIIKKQLQRGKILAVSSIIFNLFVFFCLIALILIESNGSVGSTLPEKPVIYLYPQQKQDIIVRLDYAGEIIADYPKYNKLIGGWDVTAYPDGHIVNKEDNQEYSYLFWEGISALPINWDMTKGFIIEGKNTREFLQNTLSKMGLTPKEYNEFIVYWYPRMKNNEYNLITFADRQYTESAPLATYPKPDSMLRVFMVFKPLTEKIEIKPQEIKSFERNGFAVVEWGGTEIK